MDYLYLIIVWKICSFLDFVLALLLVQKPVAFSALTLLVWLGGRKGIRPVKTEKWGADMVICLERGADLHVAQLMPLPLTVFCFI